MAELRPAPATLRFVLRGEGGAFGLGLPTTPCRAAGDWALWLGPDEWLLLTAPEEGEALRARVAGAAQDRPFSLVDVTHRQRGFVLDGDGAAELLSGAVPVDLREAAFPPGMVTRTLFEKAPILLWRLSGSAWRLEIERSFVTYVLGMLAAIAEGDGVALRLPDDRT